MKKRVLAAAALATAIAAQISGAKTLEDVLKEKGVITEADYKEVTKSRPVDYKLGNGFIFTSPDEKFQGSIGSCLQFRYTYTDLDDVNGPVKDSSRFEMRRIKLFFNGYAYSKDLTYKLQMNFANLQGGAISSGNGLLEETFMNYRMLDELQFRFGQDKVPFARQFMISSAAQQFVDLSAVTNAFAPTYDTGLMAHGKIAGGRVNYNAAVYGGLGQNTFRSTTSDLADNAFVARLTVNPLGDMKYSESDVEYSEKPLVSVGASYFQDTLRNSTAGTSISLENNKVGFASTTAGWLGVGNSLFSTASGRRFTTVENVNVTTVGADAVFKWRGLSAQGEYFIGQADGHTSGKIQRAQGFYAQAGYFVIPKHLELAARYGYLDPNRDVSGSHQIETTGAVSWYINQHNLKLQADATNTHKEKVLAGGASSTDDLMGRVQAQIIF